MRLTCRIIFCVCNNLVYNLLAIKYLRVCMLRLFPPHTHTASFFPLLCALPLFQRRRKKTPNYHFINNLTRESANKKMIFSSYICEWKMFNVDIYLIHNKNLSYWPPEYNNIFNISSIFQIDIETTSVLRQPQYNDYSFFWQVFVMSSIFQITNEFTTISVQLRWS